MSDELLDGPALLAQALQTRGILLDLIAELRDQVEWYPPDVFPGFTADDPVSQSRTPDRIAGVAMRHAWTRAGEMADRAEARLHAITHSDTPTTQPLTPRTDTH